MIPTTPNQVNRLSGVIARSGSTTAPVPRSRASSSNRAEEESRINRMFAIIAVLLVLLWLGGFFAFHIASGLIHILLVVAVIMVILHFVRGGRGGV